MTVSRPIGSTARCVLSFAAAVSAGILLVSPTAASAATCPGYESDPRNQVVGTPGKDMLHGTAGPDVICALEGLDWVYGHGGDDVLEGGFEPHRYELDWGVDIMYGGDGDDILRGSGGSDLLFGQLGNDRMYGERGSERLVGGPGADLYSGGEGPPEAERAPGPFEMNLSLERDMAIYSDLDDQRSTPLVVNLNGLPDDGAFLEGDNVLNDMEGAEGGFGDDVLIGDSSSNMFWGHDGNDRIVGGGGPNDFANAGNGNDFIDVFDGHKDDPSGLVPESRIPLNNRDDVFSCDPFGVQDGHDELVADWDDVEQLRDPDQKPPPCDEIVEPAKPELPIVGKLLLLRASCAGDSPCSGSVTAKGRRGKKAFAATGKFSVKPGTKKRTVRLRVRFRFRKASGSKRKPLGRIRIASDDLFTGLSERWHKGRIRGRR
jgi:hypothetical protein